MPRPVSSQPTEVELQILRVLWEKGPCVVRDIHAQLNDAKGTNYSTTVKMLAVMLEKGLIKRDVDARPHVYTALLTRAKAGKRMVGAIIDRIYDGSAASLILQALSGAKSTPAELAEIRQMLDQIEEKRT